MIVPTVKVCKPTEVGGYRIINASDFDPAVHTLFDEDAARAELEALRKERMAPQITHTIDRSGRWKVMRGDDEIGSGRGKGSLDTFLNTLV